MVNNGLKSEIQRWMAVIAAGDLQVTLQGKRILATKAALTTQLRSSLVAQKSFWLKRFLVY
jgi:hypothetical protein